MTPPPHPLSEISALLESRGLVLSSVQADLISGYVRLLCQWNARINLVGANDEAEIVRRHILDCLMLGTLPWPGDAREAVDIGSGAGLPGILVAILHPECRVTSVERTAKKITFQQVARDQLGLSNFIPVRGDARELTAPGGGYDLAFARGVAALDSLLALAAPLLRAGGWLWAMKGRRLAEEQARISPEVAAAYEPQPERVPYAFPELGTGGVVAVYRRSVAVAD